MQGHRNQLPPDADGWRGGGSWSQQLAKTVGVLLPLVAVGTFFYLVAWPAGLGAEVRAATASGDLLGMLRSGRWRSANGGGRASPSASSVPSSVATLATLAGMLSLLAALGIAGSIIPRQVRPTPAGPPTPGWRRHAWLGQPTHHPRAHTHTRTHTTRTCVAQPLSALRPCCVAWPALPQISPAYGWLLAYEWTLTLFCAFVALFLRLCRSWGRATGALLHDGCAPPSAAEDLLLRAALPCPAQPSPAQPSQPAQQPWGVGRSGASRAGACCCDGAPATSNFSIH